MENEGKRPHPAAGGLQRRELRVVVVLLLKLPFFSFFLFFSFCDFRNFIFFSLADGNAQGSAFLGCLAGTLGTWWGEAGVSGMKIRWVAVFDWVFRRNCCWCSSREQPGGSYLRSWRVCMLEKLLERSRRGEEVDHG